MVTFCEALMNKISKEPGVEEHEQTINSFSYKHSHALKTF